MVPKPVPAIDELPEPVVIEADDAPGEAFHTEPKAASRDSEHGGLPGDREEAEGYVEEIPSEIAGETARRHPRLDLRGQRRGAGGGRPTRST